MTEVTGDTKASIVWTQAFSSMSHILAVWSSEPVIKYCRSLHLKKSRQFTLSRCPYKVYFDSGEPMLQTFTVWSSEAQNVGVHWVECDLTYSIGVFLDEWFCALPALAPVPELYIMISRWQYIRTGWIDGHWCDEAITGGSETSEFLYSVVVIVHMDHTIRCPSHKPFLSWDNFNRMNFFVSKKAWLVPSRL